MQLLSVNVARPRELTYRGRVVRTGIFKTTVTGRVRVGHAGLDGDGQADLENHGGPHQAVYAYPFEHYAYWETELERPSFTHGQFGENLTVAGVDEEHVYVGDVFRVGSAVLQVSQPRTPCQKLAMKMDLPDFAKRFLRSGRVGFYLRVLEEGDVGGGDAMALLHQDPARLSIREVTTLRHFRRDDIEASRRAARLTALSPSWRAAFSARLAEG